MDYRVFRSNTRTEEASLLELSKTLKVIAEGRATEYFYFTALSNITGHNRLLPNVVVEYIDKIEGSMNQSHPPQLYEWVIADKQSIEGYGQEGNEYEYYIIFDLDRSRKQKTSNKEVTIEVMNELVKDEQDVFLLNTNPCFELWLLLHCDRFLEKYAEDEEVFLNRPLKYIEKVEKSTKTKYLTYLISMEFSVNVKKRDGEKDKDDERREIYKNNFLDKLNVAIKNEEALCSGKMSLDKASSNIGKHIKRILEY